MLMCLGADFDCAYIPHLCQHYAPSVDSWNVLLQSNDLGENGSRAIEEAVRMFESRLADVDANATLHMRVWRGDFGPLTKVNRLNDLAREMVPPGEWIMYVDADEFIESPGELKSLLMQCTANQQKGVYGCMVDRFAHDRKPQPILDQDDIFIKFPHREEYTKTTLRGWIHKPCLMMYEGAPLLVNCHDYSGQTWQDYRRSGRPVLTIWHFKWIESTREKLKQRVVMFKRQGLGWWRESANSLEDIYQEESYSFRTKPTPKKAHPEKAHPYRKLQARAFWKSGLAEGALPEVWPDLGPLPGVNHPLRLRLGLVSETTDAFLNQVKLCLFSLRKNGGVLSSVPITLITNSEPLSERETRFLVEHFSPIEFKTSPRLGAIPHTSKLNVFYSIDPSTYDVLLFMDCYTVVRQPLDHIADSIVQGSAEFVCRRGGKTDRNLFVDFNLLVNRFCRQGHKILYEGRKEWPMFNSGVFLATSDAVCKIRGYSVDFTYRIFNKWQRANVLERLPEHIKKQTKINQIVRRNWTIEQGALALACINAGVKVQYLDGTYNSWGGEADFHILHCFKSLYQFDRRSMFSADAEQWIAEYSASDIPGKVFLASMVREYKQAFHADDAGVLEPARKWVTEPAK